MYFQEMVKVKICGITNTEDALLASLLGADALGFIFTKKSPRFIEVKEAKKIISKLDPLISRVGVFLDEKKQEVEKTAVSLGLDVLQFHGRETPSYCSFFRNRFRVIKTLFPQNQNIAKATRDYKVDAFLLDIKLENKSSGRKALDASMLKEAKKIIGGGINIIISAGLTPANLHKVKKIKPYALDVCSGIERMVGKKDKQLMKDFILGAKNEIT